MMHICGEHSEQCWRWHHDCAVRRLEFLEGHAALARWLILSTDGPAEGWPNQTRDWIAKANLILDEESAQ